MKEPYTLQLVPIMKIKFICEQCSTFLLYCDYVTAWLNAVYLMAVVKLYGQLNSNVYVEKLKIDKL